MPSGTLHAKRRRTLQAEGALRRRDGADSTRIRPLRDALFRCKCLRTARKKDGDAGPDAQFALKADLSARLPHEPVHHRQPEPGALATFLGGEERVEDTREVLARNAAT